MQCMLDDSGLLVHCIIHTRFLDFCAHAAASYRDAHESALYSILPFKRSASHPYLSEGLLRKSVPEPIGIRGVVFPFRQSSSPL